MKTIHRYNFFKKKYGEHLLADVVAISDFKKYIQKTPINGLSEDCLNLNVWAPQGAGDEPLPIIVYIFGGGFELGSNTQTTSNLSGLAATGRAIGVSLNYRLGPFGWLSLSQYAGEFADTTNLGLQDIITALKWVRENIASFGGDPQKVTVTGHSAGAYSTIALLAAPAADGLYQRLAAFSGGASRIVPAWWAEELAITLLNEFGIADNPEQLLTLDAKLLAETLIKVSPRDIGDRHGIDNTTIGIVNDHYQTRAVLADTPLRILESGRHRDVDILFSTATNEADWWVINATEKFDPGSIDNLVDELATKSRIPEAEPVASWPPTMSTDALQLRSAERSSPTTSLPCPPPAVRSLTPLQAATPTCSAWALSREHTRYTVPKCTALSANNALDKAMSKPPVTPLSATPSSTSPQATTTGFGTL